MPFSTTWQKPYLIEFPKLGYSGEGYISVGEEQGLIPFGIKRVFWTYFTPESILRGRHAHYQTEQVLLAVAGRIIVTTELADRQITTFRLEDPFVGLYIPPNVWRTMQYSHSAVQVVIASTPYQETDYIQRYEEFREVWQSK